MKRGERMENKTSNAQIKATRNYEKTHPERVTYTTARRKAFNFLNANPKSKVGQSINIFKDEYISDLEELKRQTIDKLNSLKSNKER